MEKRFAAGEILLREGDPSDSVVLVQSGRVEVLRRVGEDEILLGTAGPGELVGEMGVLEGRARSASVRAASPVTALLMAREPFLLRVSQDPALAHRLLVRMSARLRHVEDRLAGLHAAAQGGASPAEVASIELRAVTYAGQFYIGVEPVTIERLPFTVGRAAAPDEALPTADLALAEPAPYRLSPLHFRLFAEDGRILLRDLRSELGTIVNQVPLGQDFGSDTVALLRGRNTVVAGGVGSPFVFEIELS